MIDRKKVIRGLECCNAPNRHEGCPYDGAAHYNICTHQLLTDAIALLREQERTGWISVEDRLPEEEGLYLTYGHSCDLLYYDNIRNVWISMGHDLADGEVTHWMPLPEHPEEVSGDAAD